MKNSILIVGISLLVLNTVIGLVLSGYSNFNFLFADLSILLTTGFMYYLLNSSIADGFKIGLGFFTVLLGLGKFSCAVFSPERIENNIAFIIFVCLIFLELVAVVFAQKMSKN
jgi:hypothetical protein